MYQLFSFTANELLRINCACSSAEAFMQRYGQPSAPVMLDALPGNTPRLPQEMDYTEALLYLHTSDNALRKAVKDGLIPRHTHPGYSRRFYFWRSDLDKFNANRSSKPQTL